MEVFEYFNTDLLPKWLAFASSCSLDYDEYVNSLKFQINLKPNMVGLAHGGIVSPNVLSRHLEQMINKDFSIGEIDIGGTAGEILRKQIEVNLRGLKVI